MAVESGTMQELTDPQAVTHVGPAPHVVRTTLTTRRMMLDVLIALIPVFIAGGIVFQFYALKQIAICVASCVAGEALFTAMRRRAATLGDLSAVVTGVILALSLPATAPWYVGCIGGFAAIGLGKIVFGGLGQNIFNPAMVGRAFVMITFAALMGATAYSDAGASVTA
ncbi:MAG: RnfABCDGE type electron transport complex subunit D, partial [Planctomycetota bacterium]